jgi:hypothetical protein
MRQRHSPVEKVSVECKEFAFSSINISINVVRLCRTHRIERGAFLKANNSILILLGFSVALSKVKDSRLPKDILAAIDTFEIRQI